MLPRRGLLKLLRRAGPQQLVGADIGTETLCILVIVIIVRGNHTLSLQKTQLPARVPSQVRL